MSLFSPNTITDTLPGHPFAGPRNTQKCQVYQLPIKDIPTNITLNFYSNAVEVMITQTNGVGTMVKATQADVDFTLGASAGVSYDIKVLLSGRDTTAATIIARRLIEMPAIEGRSVIVMCCFRVDKKTRTSQHKDDEYEDTILSPHEIESTKEIIDTLQNLIL